jgi:hypothetical protein
MKHRHYWMSFALGSMALAVSAEPRGAFSMTSIPSTGIVMPQGPFDQACARGSGFVQVVGTARDFQNYLQQASSGGSCYMGNLKFSAFGDLGALLNSNGFISFVQEPLPAPVTNSAAQTPWLSVVSIAASSPWALLWGTSLNYTVSTWSDNPADTPRFLQWSTRSNGPVAQGAVEYAVTTTANPAVDPACTPFVVTTAFSPAGPPCNVPAGQMLPSFEMTKLIEGSIFNDSMSGGVSVVDTFLVSGALPPEGTNPANPWMPAPPQTINQPWVFPPVTIDDPGQIRWFDPEVAIGYIYNVADPSGPLFDQYVAPDLPFNDTYELLSSGGPACSSNPDDFTTPLATITQNVLFDFPAPLACFAIKGISEQNALDPLNTLAFVAGISFDRAGTVSVSQTPIPTPGPLPLAGAGMAYGWARGLRRRVNQAAILKGASSSLASSR